MKVWIADIVFGLRQLRKAPGFTLLAIITLALGIGANTAMFTVMEDVLLRPLPYAHASRLMTLAPTGTNTNGATSWLDYQDLRRGMSHVADLAAYTPDLGVVSNRESATSVAAPRVTPNLFPMLGVKPLLGRTFTPQEGLYGGPNVVLLSAGIWKKLFHADPNIIGKSVEVEGVPHTVVGVMPASFRFPEEIGSAAQTAVWLPMQPTKTMQTARGFQFLEVLAKLKPGVSLAEVTGQMDRTAHAIAAADNNPQRDGHFKLTPYLTVVVGNIRPVMVGLSVALFLVLLIACANVANLLVARAMGRQQEFAVRIALGAGRMRLVRQVMTEGALLSAFGALLGFLLAVFALAAVHRLSADTLPRVNAISIRWSILLLMAVIASFTTILSSLVPAFLVSRANPQTVLQAASRGVGSRSVHGRLTAILVAAEIALSTLLLIGTGLLAHTLWNLEHVELGFSTTRLTAFNVTPASSEGFTGAMAPVSSNAAAASSVAVLKYKPILDRLRQAPGIEDAAYTSMLPLTNNQIASSFNVVEHPLPESDFPQALFVAVGGNYARLMSTPVLRGRMIDGEDKANSTPVVVINQALAQRFFPKSNPIGQHLSLGGKETGIVVPPVIIGVLADQRTAGVTIPAKPTIYIPAVQVPPQSLFYGILVNMQMNFLVKTRGQIEVASEVRDIFHQMAPSYALDNFETLQSVVNQTVYSQKLGFLLTASFAGLAVLMVIVGLYGVLAQYVGFRRREIGIRLALGASRSQVLRMIFAQGFLLAACGLGCGVVISLLAGRLVSSFLYGIHAFDPLTYVGVLGLLFAVSIAAAVWPARQAALVDPMTTLRMD